MSVLALYEEALQRQPRPHRFMADVSPLAFPGFSLGSYAPVGCPSLQGEMNPIEKQEVVDTDGLFWSASLPPYVLPPVTVEAGLATGSSLATIPAGGRFPLNSQSCGPVKNSSRLSTSSIIGNSRHCEPLRVQHQWTGKRPFVQRENHIWSERERRKGMNRLFCVLRSLLPEPIVKADKSSVVSEIIKYIDVLRKDIQDLTNRKAFLVSKSSWPWDSATSTATRSQVPKSLSPTCIATPNVALHIFDDNVFLNLVCSRRPSALISILWTVRQHQLILLNATISAQGNGLVYCIHSKAKDVNHFARESLHSSLLKITQPMEPVK